MRGHGVTDLDHLDDADGRRRAERSAEIMAAMKESDAASATKRAEEEELTR